jgi:hypothetical protein
MMDPLEQRSFLSVAAAAETLAAHVRGPAPLVMGPRTADAGAVAATGCPSKYQGTYIGQFNVKYMDWSDPERPVQRSRSFRLTVTLACMSGLSPAAALRVTKVQSSDPFFGATRAVRPRAGSMAVLPVPTRNVSNRAGQGLMILFPNGASLGTANGKGQLRTSSDGRTIGNVVGVKHSWVALKGSKLFLEPTHAEISSTWAMTKSAL